MTDNLQPFMKKEHLGALFTDLHLSQEDINEQQAAAATQKHLESLIPHASYTKNELTVRALNYYSGYLDCLNFAKDNGCRYPMCLKRLDVNTCGKEFKIAL